MARETSKNVRLEVDLLDNGRIQPATDERSTLPDGRWSILVVDDDPDMRTFVRTCLRRLDPPARPPVEAANGQVALDLIRSRHFDLVISDVVMPRMSGTDLCRALRADPELRHTRVLLVTGELSAVEVQEFAREADAVILKPFNARQLCEQVLRVLDRGPPSSAT